MNDTATTDADSIARVAAARPNWSAVHQQTLCPLCDYNLHGIDRPRCPECGHQFTWEQLFDPSFRFHPYIFEHHPEKNVRSFFRTLWGGLRPKKFWTSLHPAQPSRPRRLLIYALSGLVPLLFACVAQFVFILSLYGLQSAQERNWIRRTFNSSENIKYRQQVLNRYGSIDRYLDVYCPVSLTGLYRKNAAFIWRTHSWGGSAILAAWMPLTLLTMSLFRWSMRRARVRWVHLARCAVYCGDAIWWFPLVLLVGDAALLCEFSSTPGSPLRYEPVKTVLAVSLLGFVIVFAYRLCIAYRRYLQFPRAVAVVLAGQVIVFLIVINIYLPLARR